MGSVLIGRGSLAGASGHALSGDFELRHDGNSATLNLDATFSFDGAPEPWWGLGRGGVLVPGTLLAKLPTLAGVHIVEIPSTVDPRTYDTLILWCRKCDVLLGSGPIARMFVRFSAYRRARYLQRAMDSDPQHNHF